MSNWKKYKLGELLEINKNSIGKNYPFDEIEYIDTSSVTENRFSEFQRLKIDEAPSRAKRIVCENDIIYSTVRPIQRHYGIIKKAKPNLVASTGFAVLTTKKIDPYFLYYFLSQNHIVDYLNSVAESNTTTFPAFNPSLFETLEILAPDLPTQRQIAQILSSLDDKIELNLQMNQTLEAMAQAIFKEWFVNFNFPGFDGELVDGLPKGWRMGKLGECVTIKRGGSPRPIQEFISEKGLRWLKISDVTSLQTPFILETKEYIKEEGLSKTTLLKSGCLVLSNSATPGIPKILHVDSCIHDGWLHFPNSIFSNEFLYLKFLELRRELVQKANGSIFTNLKTDIVRDFDIVIPGKNILTEFDNVIKPIFKKLLENTLQIKALTQTRDTLLPKLMSGKIRLNTI